MRSIILALLLAGATAFACGASSNSCGNRSLCEKSTVPLVEPISYAFQQMHLEDNSDIRTAMAFYKKTMRTLTQDIPLDAFKEGHFNPDVFSKMATSSKILTAQKDLLETIDLILTDDQKKEFVMLIGIYQHHMKFLNQQECGNQKSSCSNKKVCNHDTKKASIKEIPLIPRH